jgi:hypothetical protein
VRLPLRLSASGQSGRGAPQSRHQVVDGDVEGKLGLGEGAAGGQAAARLEGEQPQRAEPGGQLLVGALPPLHRQAGVGEGLSGDGVVDGRAGRAGRGRSPAGAHRGTVVEEVAALGQREAEHVGPEEEVAVLGEDHLDLVRRCPTRAHGSKHRRGGGGCPAHQGEGVGLVEAEPFVCDGHPPTHQGADRDVGEALAHELDEAVAHGEEGVGQLGIGAGLGPRPQRTAAHGPGREVGIEPSLRRGRLSAVAQGQPRGDPGGHRGGIGERGEAGEHPATVEEVLEALDGEAVALHGSGEPDLHGLDPAAPLQRRDRPEGMFVAEPGLAGGDGPVVGHDGHGSSISLPGALHIGRVT